MTEIIRKFCAQGVLGNLTYRSGGSFIVLTSILFSQQKVQFPLLPLAPEKIDPDTLNKSSNGTWVVVYIELPAGYNVTDIDISSIKLEGTVLAETWPYAIGDHDKDGISDLMVKFKRSDVIKLLPLGESVPVHVTGKAGTTTFEGVDVIRVMK
jgi:hypothetical protein